MRIDVAASKSPPTTAGDGALPGEREVDEALLRRCVLAIRALYGQGGLAASRQIGELLLNTFFKGNSEDFERTRRFHVTYRALLSSKDLPTSNSFLWYSIRLIDHLKLLPHEIADVLPLSHHRLLMHIHQPEIRIQMAQMAADKGWSKRRLEAAVRESTPRTRRRSAGRPRTPSFVKGLRQLNEAVELVGAEKIDHSLLGRVERDELAGLLQQAATDLERLSGLMGTIQEKMIRD